MRISRRVLITAGVVTTIGATAGTAFATAPMSGSGTSRHMSTATGSVPACRTTQLAIWRAEPGDGTTGSTFYELELSNVSTSTCSLTGFPRVVAVDKHGTQLGRAATHDTMFAPKTVVLHPRTTAHAVLRVTDAGAFSPATCNPTAAAGVKVFPPGRPRAGLVPLRFTACSSDGPAVLSVRVVRPRVGVPGVSE